MDRRLGALVDEDVDGRSLLDETALREHAECSSRPWRQGRRLPEAHAAERDGDRHWRGRARRSRCHTNARDDGLLAMRSSVAGPIRPNGGVPIREPS